MSWEYMILCLPSRVGSEEKRAIVIFEIDFERLDLKRV